MTAQEEPRLPDPPAPDLGTSPPAEPFRLAQLLLDPRSLHALMGTGGGLLALGLVIWLAVIGLFDEPLHAAIGLGAANFGLLGLGVWAASRTRYRTAGRGVAMLACLLLPLNLWFYDAQGLVTLAGQGSLWVPALVCCLVYAGVARLLKDSLFVYTFAAGVAMTGLLFLADGDIGRFWEVLAPSTLLVSLGVGGIHAERLFPKAVEAAEPNPFSRDDFGRAFFRAGHVLLAGGLAVLAAGRIAGLLFDPVFGSLGWFTQPDVTKVATAQVAAIGLTLVGTYAYVYSRLARGGNLYTLAAAITVAWAGLIGCDLIRVGLHGTLLVVTAIGLLAAVADSLATQPMAGFAGRALVAIAAAAGFFLAGARLLTGEVNGELLGLLVAQLAMNGVTIALTRRGEPKTLLLTLGLGQTIVTGLTIKALSTLTGMQQFELFATVVGVGLTVAGLVGWRRETLAGQAETERPEAGSMTDFNLWVGGLLAVVPPALGLIVVRLGDSDPGWTLLHEVGVLAIGIALATAGALCRLRAPTLAGAGALTAYLVSLVTLIHLPEQLQSVAFCLMAGGGLLFGGAILLSVYRDRLLAIPERARQGEGVFAVLKWR